MHQYFPHTESDLQAMCRQIGIRSLDDLYAEVPSSLRFRDDYQVPPAMSEMEVRQHFEQMGHANRPLVCFAGAGVYDHYTPAVIPSLLQRSEWLTSYTPYQAEISQGTLHAIFEYQSMMTTLTGMDISNASMYDGSTATAEAVMMAVAAAKKSRTILISATVDPKIRAVVETYAHFQDITLETVAACNGVTDRAALDSRLQQGGVAGLLVQQPNYYGIVENYEGVAQALHGQNGLFIMNSIIADLAVLKTPGELGADIAVGDGQSLGIPMQFGGPYVGYLCCTEKLLRKLPGRIVGRTVDSRGQRAFVLTLQAREQHIRRQKATSNICSNQSLMALFVTVYCALMGPQGLRQAAQLSYAGAHYLCDGLLATGRCRLAFDQPFFNEFVVCYDGDTDAFQRRCVEQGIFGGVKVGDGQIMFAVTEKRTKEEIDKLIALI